MNHFVDECRREWRRLGVRRSVADEMAAELAADLEEGTPEDVLAGDASDARSFAHHWAAERGVVSRRRRAWVPATLAVLALIPTVIGAVLLLTDDTSDSASAPSRSFTVWVAPPPDAQRADTLTVIARQHDVVRARAQNNIVALIAERNRLRARDDNPNTLGSVLLIAGLAVLVPLTLLWSGRVALNR
jgi:hypothetical protein